MKFTLSWLNEHLDTNVALADLVHHLTMLGIEVEDFEDPAISLAPFLIAEIKRIEKHPDADRLNVCFVQIDQNVEAPLIQVVCGAPNVYEGMKTVFAHIGSHVPGLDIVLKKGKIRGVESNGMLCSLTELQLGDDHDGIIDLPKDAPVGLPFAQAFGHDDPIIEVGITPNRADCFGVQGIARDIAALGFGKLKQRDIKSFNAGVKSNIDVSIEASDECFAYAGRIIKNIKNVESPNWLKQRLRKIGIEPKSAVVDVTNYINYDMCRPLHAFDADKLKGNICVRKAKEGEEILGLDDKTYTLSTSHLIIADADAPVAIAGVLGGEKTAVQADTTNIFLESALFAPTSVMQSGRELNIHTDSRTRFERGVSPDSMEKGLDFATQMILDICGGEASDVVRAGKVPNNEHNITLSLSDLKLRSGIEIPASKIDTILRDLGFKNIEFLQGNLLTVTSPNWRFDLQQDCDVMEEILRVNGYDQVPATPLPATPGFKALDFKQSVKLKAKKVLATEGFMECVHYAFTSEQNALCFGEAEKLIKVSNPISQQLSVMRTSILGSLLESIQRNLAYGVKNLRLFELGSIYAQENAQAHQQSVLSAILTGNKTDKSWSAAELSYDVFDIKSAVFTVLSSLNIAVDALQIVTEGLPSYYHPGQSAAIKMGPKLTLAYFGRVHPLAEKNFGVDVPVFGFEVFMDKLPVKPLKNKAYHQNVLQRVDRDFAFLVDKTIAAQEIIRAVRKAEKNHIEDVNIFDVYAGKGVPDDKKSVAVSVRLAPKATTFTDEDLQRMSDAIIQSVEKSTGAELRGV